MSCEAVTVAAVAVFFCKQNKQTRMNIKIRTQLRSRVR